MSSLIEYYKENNITEFEGYSQQVKEQILRLSNMVKAECILDVMEIGFNAGHSSEIFYHLIRCVM